MADVDIPYVKSIEQVSDCFVEIKTFWADYKQEYNKLFDWMEQQPKL